MQPTEKKVEGSIRFYGASKKIDDGTSAYCDRRLASAKSNGANEKFNDGFRAGGRFA
jgi:hypothetical protein